MSLAAVNAQAGIKGPLKELQFVAFDVETTGLSAIACRLVELSGVKFDVWHRDVSTFSSLINPGSPIPPEVSKIHGITDDMVKDAPKAEQVLRDFLHFARGGVWLAHNAAFDVEFLKIELLRQKQPLPEVMVLDTLTLAQVVLSGPENFKLKTLAEYFGFGGAEYHRALADSVYVEKLFGKLLEVSHFTTVEELNGTGALKSFSDWGRPASREHLPESVKSHICLLEAAIESSSTVKLKYQGEFLSTRTVQPEAVIESRGSLYLSAYCLKSRAQRTFRVDRIVEAIINT